MMKSDTISSSRKNYLKQIIIVIQRTSPQKEERTAPLPWATSDSDSHSKSNSEACRGKGFKKPQNQLYIYGSCLLI